MPRPFAPIPEDALPPEDVRLVDLTVEPQADNRRVKVRLVITPFQKDPSVELTIQNNNHDEVSRVFVIETIDDHLLFTMHLKGEIVPGEYSLHARLYYEEPGTVDERDVTFCLNDSSEG